MPCQGSQKSNFLHVENVVIPNGCRRKRKFIPDEKKDVLYWEKRHKNNEAAKRSREKRRMNDYVLEYHLMAMKEENARLKAELWAMKVHFGLVHPAANSSHQSLQKDFYWGGRDPSGLSGLQLHHPLCIPAHAIPAMRGYLYSSPSGSFSSGLHPSLVQPQNVLPISSFSPGALLKPIPTRAASDEEEQRVPGVLSLPCSARVARSPHVEIESPV